MYMMLVYTHNIYIYIYHNLYPFFVNIAKKKENKSFKKNCILSGTKKK